MITPGSLQIQQLVSSHFNQYKNISDLTPILGRSPCPMLNALANHGFLPRDGVNISMDNLVTGLSDSINLAAAATQFVGAKALTASTTGNASTFNLDDLNTHHSMPDPNFSNNQRDLSSNILHSPRARF